MGKRIFLPVQKTRPENFRRIELTPQSYETAMYARAVWMLARSNDVNELAAIACTIRNHVIIRPGQPQTYESYAQACADFLKAYPSRQEPTLAEPALTSYPDGLLTIIEKVYDCSYKDITATQTTPGARYFGQVASLPADNWMQQIARTHQILGTFGAQQFFA
jgi:hypothetical protein